MNKTQFYTLSGALLASTALSGAASAGTVGRYDATNTFTTTPLSISNGLFSTTATTADQVIIGGSAGEIGVGMRYTNAFSGTTRWTTEFTISGARFITGALTTGNVKLLLATLSSTSTIINSISGTNGALGGCASVSTLVNLFVVNDCALTAGHSRAAVGIAFTGVTFNTASALATAGSSVTLTGRVYNPQNTSQIFEEANTGTMLTSAAPYQVIVTAGADQTASATTTPTAFTSLTTAGSELTMTLATVRLSATGALQAGLGTTVSTNSASTTSVTLASSVLSGGAVRTVRLNSTAGGSSLSYLTAANFSGGSVTFGLTNTLWAAQTSFNVSVEFRGTTAIPAAVAGTISGSLTSGDGLQPIAYSGATAAVAQGGFRAEINTFNASTNGPFGSYLRIHNNGQVAGVVTITVRNDATGEVLGSPWTTESIAINATKQFTALEIENGAEIPSESRSGSYTLSVTGPIIGYTQHILFDGNSVADLSGFRNAGSTQNVP